MAETLSQEEAIFQAALEFDADDQRAAYLDAVCADRRELRKRVEALLRRYKESAGPLDRPVSARAATTDQPVAERPGTVIGPYKLMEQVGEGGMGLVFVAEQQHPVRRKVALKVIKPGMDTRQVVARFEAERQALALMDHPNIAKVLEAGATESGRPYFVMELVKGVPITEFCDDNRLRPRERLELFIDVCAAVQHAHHKGVIHRDIKPSNVMVSSHDGTPVVKVIDFGVAKAIGQQLTDKTVYTQLSQLVGTPLYMSPEQAGQSGLDVDTRSDIYSLGVLLYELLTGTTPFDKDRFKEADYDEIRRIIREEEPPKPSTRISTLGQAATTISSQRKSDPKRLSQLFRGELDWIVMKALEKDRNRRYETANAFAQDVQRYLNDEAVLACPPSVGYRLRKFVRRNKAGLSVAAGVLLAVTVMAATIGWAVRDRAARRTIVEQAVARALEETETACDRARWPEASAALKRAEELLSSGQTSEELRERVRQWRANLGLVARLEEARMLGTQVNVAKSQFQSDLTVPEIETAFRDQGIAPESMSAEQAGQWIRSRPTAIQLAAIAALDHWLRKALLSRKQAATDAGKQAWLEEVLRAADGDPWRTRMRKALHRKDRSALVELAKSPELVQQAPQTLLSLGRLLHGRPTDPPDLGLTVLRTAQRLYPDDFWVNHELGWLLKDGKQPVQRAEAVRFYSIAVALQPKNAGALLNLGRALTEQRNFDEAIAVCRRALDLKPEYANVHDVIGYALHSQRKLDAAIAAHQKAVALNPKFAGAHCNLGVCLHDLGKLDEAIAAYRQAIELQPNFVFAHCNLGNALKAQGKLDEAITEYRKAIAADPNDGPAHTYLGLALDHHGKLEEAMAEHQKAIALDPDCADAYLNRGKVLSQQDKLDQAIADYRKTIELDPKRYKAYSNLGIALSRQGKPAEALAACRKAVELNPNYAPAHCNLGSTLSRQGKLEQAIAALRQAIALKPDLVEAHHGLGIVLLKQRKLEEAVAELRQAIALEPDYVEAHYDLALVLLEQGKPDEAIAELRKVIALKPDHANAHSILGKVLCDTGQFAEGLIHLKRGDELAGGDELAARDRVVRPPTAQWLRECERMVELDAKLTRVLAGTLKPADAREQVAFAEVCHRKRQFEQASRFYEAALAQQPGLAEDLKSGHRYNAACSATRASIGERKDANSLNDEQRTRRGRQALDWLRADLQQHTRNAHKATPGIRVSTVRTLQHWVRDPDLAGLREEDRLAKLPMEEREAFLKLWREVRELLKRLQDKN